VLLVGLCQLVLVSDADVIEVLNTNFHCTLDDDKIGKSDSLRHFDSRKISEGIYRVSAMNDEKIVNIIENWKVPGQFDDRAFMNSANSDITIKIKKLERIT
jgi:hypothetical protein